MNITPSLQGACIVNADGKHIVMRQEDQQKLLKHMWLRNPEMVRGVVCCGCKELEGMGEHQNYCLNKAESGE
jgi:hypothetical protein